MSRSRRLDMPEGRREMSAMTLRAMLAADYIFARRCRYERKPACPNVEARRSQSRADMLFTTSVRTGPSASSHDEYFAAHAAFYRRVI